MVHDVGQGYLPCGWLGGRASPCQGEGREFESLHPLAGIITLRGCSSVVEHLLAKERAEFESLHPLAGSIPFRM